MRVLLTITLGLVVLAGAKAVLDFEGDNHEHEQTGEPGSAVRGEYSWESPEGQQFIVKYIADDKGFRILESNAVPSAAGVSADGHQGNLEGVEEEEEDDDDRK